jgi:hypothetical protein
MSRAIPFLPVYLRGVDRDSFIFYSLLLFEGSVKLRIECIYSSCKTWSDWMRKGIDALNRLSGFIAIVLKMLHHVQDPLSLLGSVDHIDWTGPYVSTRTMEHSRLLVSSGRTLREQTHLPTTMKLKRSALPASPGKPSKGSNTIFLLWRRLRSEHGLVQRCR